MIVTRSVLSLGALALAACSVFTEVRSPIAGELVTTQEFSRPLPDVSACLVRALDLQSYGSAQPTTFKTSTPSGVQITRWFASKSTYERQIFVLGKLDGNRTQLAIYVQPRSGEKRLGRFGNLAIAAAATCAAG